MRPAARAIMAAAGASGGGGVTLPTAGLTSRLAAATGVSPGPTFTWFDQEGSADAVQSTALDQPTYAAGASVDFDGVDHWLDWTGLTLGASWTIFFRLDNTGIQATGTKRVFSNAGVEFYDRLAGSTQLVVGGTAATAAHVEADQLLTIQCDASSGLATIWRDGVDVSGGGVSVTPTAITGDVGLMGRYANGLNASFGRVKAVIAYSTALNATQREAVREWIAAEVPALPAASLISRLSARAGVTTGATFAWADQVGSFDATQSTALDQPTYTAGVSVDFDGVDHWLDWDSLATAGSAYTIFFAINQSSTAGTQRFFNSTLGGDVRLFTARSGNLECYISGTYIGTTSATTGNQIITVQDDGAGTAYLYRDGTDLTSGGTSVTSVGLGGALGLGGSFAGTELFTGSIYEVLVYDAAIDATQRAAARAWLTAEHGL